MIYLTRMLGRPVVDAAGETIGTIHDIAIATGEIFPRVTSLAFVGPDKTPFMLSWRKYVAEFDGDHVALTVPAADIRFSYLQPTEVLLSRDLLNKQIVDTQGMKVVRVNDLKLSESRNQLRLLGAEVGARGILRGISPALERTVDLLARLVGRPDGLPENIIAWNYMDLLDRDLSHVRLSVTHKRLHELHPADIADVLEQLGPAQRAMVFEHLDNAAAAEAISELEDELQADVIDDLGEARASDILEIMDPDDAADIIGDLPYDKAEALLRLMGVSEAREVRKLLGYKEKTAGGIMTPEVTKVTEGMTVGAVIDHLRKDAAENESIYYVYVTDDDGRLTGVLSLRDLIVSAPETAVSDIAERDLFMVDPDDDQEDVAEMMAKYDLLALPVVDERGRVLGIVTVDDALDVLEEEAEEDLAIATGSAKERGPVASLWGRIWRRSIWVAVWGAALGAVLGLADAAAIGTAPVLLDEFGLQVAVFAALLMPVLLRTAEEASSRAVAEIIEGDEDERPRIGTRLLTEGLVGFAVGAVAGVFAGVVGYLLGGLDPGLGLTLGVATGASVLATVVFGSVLADAALSLSARGRQVSSTALSLVSMAFAAVAYVVIAYAFGVGAVYLGIVSSGLITP
ncbi:MAG: magnesium transporter [Coriobacteriaceae bacterium]|nr:magnesium transporter [Coriobacteriaceae bacterium]